MFKEIKNFFKLFKSPKYKYIFLCKYCDIFFDRIGFYNKCPICGHPAEVYKADLIEED